jgi:hypothetical protein
MVGWGRSLGFPCPQAVVEAPVGQRRTTSATAWAPARYPPRYLVAALRKSAQAHLTGPHPSRTSERPSHTIRCLARVLISGQVPRSRVVGLVDAVAHQESSQR